MTYKTLYFIEDQEKKRKAQKQYSLQLDKPEDKKTWRPVLGLIERGEPKLAVTSGRPRRYVQGGVTSGCGGFQAARCCYSTTSSNPKGRLTLLSAGAMCND
jgi:hypothetical protein